jgi:hypothetical protein
VNRLPELPLSIRIPVCAVALAAILILFASRTFPEVPLLAVFAWAVGAVAIAGALYIAYFVLVAGWHTWSADHAAADSCLLRFDNESPVLQALCEDGDGMPSSRQGCGASSS